jgi:hypothetical protein
MNSSSRDARRSPLALAVRLAGVLLIGVALFGFTTTNGPVVSETTGPVAVAKPTSINLFAVGPVTRANAAPGRPVGLQLASGNILDVVAVGKTADRVMELPDNPSTVGWYTPGGVRPGSPGTAVFAAHVDARVYGLGPFVALHTIELGTVIRVHHDDGEISVWQVRARELRKKDELIDTGVFVTSGPPQIALITCGGRFDAATRSYDSNVIVTAVPFTPETKPPAG